MQIEAILYFRWMRKKIVAGNWKMNGLQNDARMLTLEVVNLLKGIPVNADHIILAPPFPFISLVAELTKDDPRIMIAAQNCSDKEAGAFTGEVSASMIQSAGASAVIVGHSERRAYYQESDEMIALKVKKVLGCGMLALFCCGESLTERKGGQHFDTVKKQIETGLFTLNEQEIKKSIIAYEPVWAIGTGETASPKQAQEMHAFIRSLVETKYGKEISDTITLVYGGSCNDKNAGELFMLDDVDGGLIGGASLKAASFISIICSLPA